MTAIAPRPLIRIADDLDDVEIAGDANISITSIVDDSRTVTPGALFIASAVQHGDGARFLRDAFARGAAAVVIDRDSLLLLPLDVSALIVPDVRRALARLAARAQGNPAQALRIAGITGTNGKTTTSFMIATLLADAGHATLRIGTLGAAWKDREVAIGYTTPPPLELHHLFAQALADGVDTAVMEVSSHALALDRVADLPFAVGVFTNLTRDHLDFHENFEAYAAAKRRLFVMARTGIFNVDDAYGRLWCDEFGGVSYAIDSKADVMAQDLVLHADGSRFSVDGAAFVLPVPGRFNVLNALAAIAVGKACGVSLQQMQASFARFRGVPGRMERFAIADCTVIVDYSHTPDALERVLLAVRESTGHPMTVVFGCGGDRDSGKRPQMGAIAERLADRVIITSDNPRTEDPQSIANAILAGTSGAVECILDRHVAIERAILEAPSPAIVVIAGKGAELEQIIGTQKFLFDDRREAERALALRAAREMEQSNTL